MGHDRISWNTELLERDAAMQVFRDPGKTQGTIPDTEHPVMITVSEHSETRDM